MNNTELVEAVADITGIKIYWKEGWSYRDSTIGPSHWNPLYRDQHAFQLMVDHTLLVIPQGRYIIVDWYGPGDAVEEPIGDDKRAATRRAIVRAVIEKARECNRPNCNLTPPCPDCGLALHDVPEGA